MSYAQFWNQQYQPPVSQMGSAALPLGQQMLDQAAAKGFANNANLTDIMQGRGIEQQQRRGRRGAGWKNIAKPGQPPMWVTDPGVEGPPPVNFGGAPGMPYRPVPGIGPTPPGPYYGEPIQGSGVQFGNRYRQGDIGPAPVPYGPDAAQPAYMGGYGRRRMTSPQPRFGFF